MKGWGHGVTGWSGEIAGWADGNAGVREEGFGGRMGAGWSWQRIRHEELQCFNGWWRRAELREA